MEYIYLLIACAFFSLQFIFQKLFEERTVGGLSVCLWNQIVCSIGGKDMKTHSCQHIKGRKYKGKLCYGILENPTDAYEWSFVAVPAQRNAGVTKAFSITESENISTQDIIKSVSQGFAVSQAESQALSRYISELEEAASEIQSYKSGGLLIPSLFSLLQLSKTKHLKYWFVQIRIQTRLA